MTEIIYIDPTENYGPPVGNTPGRYRCCVHCTSLCAARPDDHETACQLWETGACEAVS